ncbi:MAG: NAD(P)/FAD-dependent oxidoreductase [Proteobacteria bacterium]|nr:NAD(P)/FAD-dependent oxidoreductase [Pseudomonadota bacterium]
MNQEAYDVVVLGGGAGGVPAAIRAAQLGGRVALIECKDLGGACMNKGCVPFGHLRVAADILGALSFGKEFGFDIPEISKNYNMLRKRQNEMISFMREGVKGLLGKNKVKVIRGVGKLAGQGKMEVGGESLLFRKAILAAGARWTRPDFPGADREGVINTDDFLEADKLPGRVLLFGRSPWLLGLAQSLIRFGSQVTLATREEGILPDENKTVRTRLDKVLKRQGIEILTHAEILGVEKTRGGLQCTLTTKGSEERISVDRVVTLERRASLKDLGLGSVGIDESGDCLRTNEKLETAAAGIYAIGDLSAPETSHYSHRASTGGVIAAENAMGLERILDPRSVVRVTFTQPQVACVGMTTKEAKRAGHDLVVGAAPLSMNPLGMILSQTEGIVEIVSEKRYGEILGVHIVADNASEMAGQATLAMQMEMTLEDLARATFPHPTLSESLAEAARDALGQAIYLP